MWKKSESGQSLLVIVLLISVVFTIIATASYRLTTETQTTRLQEESIRTLAAADGGIERGVQYANSTAETPVNPATGTNEVTYLSLGLTAPGIDASKSTMQVTATQGMTFLSPRIAKDDEFTYYMYQYPSGTTSTPGNLNLYFGSTSGCAAPTALDIAVIYNTNGTNVGRGVADPCNIVNGNNELTTSAGTTIDGTALQYMGVLPLGAAPSPKLVIVRVIGSPTYIGFKSANSGVNLYSQGQLIRSKAVSTTGVTKVVTLFKSYPQIPSDFFVTRF